MSGGHWRVVFAHVLLIGALAGCATPAPAPSPAPNHSYVTLLPSPDGSVGVVEVQGTRGTQRLTRAHDAALLDGSQAPAPVDAARFKRDFADAIAARPELPLHFMLYFETGGTQLTPESMELLPRIVDRAAHRRTVDLSVIGHSDTVGKTDLNDNLSLRRAQTVAEIIKGMGLKVDALVVESHGKRNLLVPTPDGTPEPRNRRVEVTIR